MPEPQSLLSQGTGGRQVDASVGCGGEKDNTPGSLLMRDSRGPSHAWFCKDQNWGLSQRPGHEWCLGPPHARAVWGDRANPANWAVARGDPQSSPAVSLCLGAGTWDPTGAMMRVNQGPLIEG